MYDGGIIMEMSKRKKIIIGFLLGALVLSVPIGVYLLSNRSNEEEEIVDVEEMNPKYIKTVIDDESVEFEGPNNIREDKVQSGNTKDSYIVYEIADFEVKYKTHDVYYKEAAEGGDWINPEIIEGTEKEHQKSVVMRKIDGEWVLDSDVDLFDRGEAKGPYQ